MHARTNPKSQPLTPQCGSLKNCQHNPSELAPLDVAAQSYTPKPILIVEGFSITKPTSIL